MYIATEKNNFNIVWMSQVDFIVISESRLKCIFNVYFHGKIVLSLQNLAIFFKYNNYSFLRAQHFTTRLCITDETCRLSGLYLRVHSHLWLHLAGIEPDPSVPLSRDGLDYLHIHSYPNYSNNLLNSYSYSIFLFGILLFK